jgi:Domain of unknown function (DUF3560)
LLELCEEIEDDDTSRVDRAEDRAERFEGYGERRAGDAEAARDAVARIADGIPMGLLGLRRLYQQIYQNSIFFEKDLIATLCNFQLALYFIFPSITTLFEGRD